MDALGLMSSQKKLIMWYKVTELKSNGLHCAQIACELGIHRHTVEKYVKMTRDEFLDSQSYERNFKRKLDDFEEEIKNELIKFPFLSSRQIHDHLRERHSDFPQVSEKTVFNFVMHVRKKYGISKSNDAKIRPFEKLPETEPGVTMQADFGEYWMHRDDNRRVKVYFFVAVMSYSRHKYVYFSKTPFTSEMAIYAHQLAFQFYGAKPREIIYDQDKVFIHNENYGDVVLTKLFQAFVSSEHFKCVFCRKSDPQSKGKVENVVKYVKYNFLRGRDFTTIEMLNESAIRWLARTANGLPHSTTKRIPSDAFAEELPHMIPYTGTPNHPRNCMKEYLVRKDNTISYHGHFYNVPTGTYCGDGTFVWVSYKDEKLEIYSNETGKLLVRHEIARNIGQSIIDESIQRPKLPSRKELENYILSYLDGNELVAMWLKNLYETKPRYYRANINHLNAALESFLPEALIKSFEICLDKGNYNANDLINYCEKHFGRMPNSPREPSIAALLPPTLQEYPQRTNINDYKFIFR